MYGYPKEAAGRIALNVVRKHEARLKRIVACCFSSEDAEIYRQLLEVT